MFEVPCGVRIRCFTRQLVPGGPYVPWWEVEAVQADHGVGTMASVTEEGLTFEDALHRLHELMAEEARKANGNE